MSTRSATALRFEREVLVLDSSMKTKGHSIVLEVYPLQSEYRASSRSEVERRVVRNTVDVPLVATRVGDLVDKLLKCDQDAYVLTKPENARSRCLTVQQGQGFRGNYGYILDDGYHGFDQAESEGKTFPVVWV